MGGDLRATPMGREIDAKLPTVMHRNVRLFVTGLFVTVALMSPRPAHAQTAAGFERPTALPPLGRDPVSSADTTAVVMNPAVLAFMPGAELRWTGMFMSENSTLPQQGHAIGLGFPIPFLRLGTALRVDMINPPNSANYPEYQLLSWGMGIRLTDARRSALPGSTRTPNRSRFMASTPGRLATPRDPGRRSALVSGAERSMRRYRRADTDWTQRSR